MQSSRFASISRWTAQRFTRRTAVTQAAALGLGALASRPVRSQDATPVASPVAEAPFSLLFVQHAGSTTLTPGAGDVHTLVMTGVIDQTLYFSDRPYRIAGTAPTTTFAEKFPEMFVDSPPNATLIGHVEHGAHEEEAVVLTLLSAVYDPAAAALTYQVKVLDAEAISNRAFELEPLTALDAPRDYVDASLFIDEVSPLGHGTNPTQTPLGTPIALLFIPQEILFIPAADGS